MNKKYIALDSNVLFLLSALMYDKQNTELYEDFKNEDLDFVRGKYSDMPFEELPQIFRKQLEGGSYGLNFPIVYDAYRLHNILFDKKNNYRLVILPAVLNEVEKNSMSVKVFMKRHCKVLKFSGNESKKLFQDLTDSLVEKYLENGCFAEEDIADARIMAEASIWGIDNLVTFNHFHFISTRKDSKNRDYEDDIRKKIKQTNRSFYDYHSKELNRGTLTCSPVTPWVFTMSHIRNNGPTLRNIQGIDKTLAGNRPDFYSYTAFSNSLKLQKRNDQKRNKKKSRDKATPRHHLGVNFDYRLIEKEQRLTEIRELQKKKEIARNHYNSDFIYIKKSSKYRDHR